RISRTNENSSMVSARPPAIDVDIGWQFCSARLVRAAIYARVSTTDQHPENQLAEIDRYVTARGWTSTVFVDHGVSGRRDRRPALDALLVDAKRRRFEVVC